MGNLQLPIAVHGVRGRPWGGGGKIGGQVHKALVDAHDVLLAPDQSRRIPLAKVQAGDTAVRHCKTDFGGFHAYPLCWKHVRGWRLELDWRVQYYRRGL